MANDYSGSWRTWQGADAVNWADSWQGDQTMGQQIKAAPGGSSSDYDQKFADLTKSSSDVDDGAGWKTVKSLENSKEGTRAEMESLANEWKAKGYDVRVQDLDSSEGAAWADLAVRKTEGTGGQETEPELTPQSRALSSAKAYKAAKEEADIQGDTTQMSHGYNPVSAEEGYKTSDGQGIANRFLENYQNKFLEESQTMTPTGNQVPKKPKVEVTASPDL